MKTFKYLGVTISDNLSVKDHIEQLSTKANQRLYVLRKLRSFNGSQNTLLTVYNSLIKSVITFGIATWYGPSNIRDKKVHDIIRNASKITNKTLESASDIHQRETTRKAF